LNNNTVAGLIINGIFDRILWLLHASNCKQEEVPIIALIILTAILRESIIRIIIENISRAFKNIRNNFFLMYRYHLYKSNYRKKLISIVD